jgi:predicted Zn-dependent protease
MNNIACMKRIFELAIVFVFGCLAGYFIKDNKSHPIIEVKRASSVPSTKEIPTASEKREFPQLSKESSKKLPMSPSGSALSKSTQIPDLFFHALTANGAEAEVSIHELEKLGEREKALEAFSHLLLRENKVQFAKSTANNCLKEFPSNKGCLIVLANAELQVGSKEDQLNAVKTCLKIYPKDPQCQNILGLVRMNQGSYEDAISIFEEVSKSNGSYGVRFDESVLAWQFATAQEMAGKIQDAIYSYERACQFRNVEACQKAEELRGQL